MSLLLLERYKRLILYSVVYWPEDDDGVELLNEITILNDIEDEEAISDYISDVTGFCYKGFELEE